MPDQAAGSTERSRRAPPPLRSVTVVERRELSPRMLRISFEGESLGQMQMPEPAGSVRLLVPTSSSADLVIPIWSGNEFLLPDGSRPVIRTFTPLRFDPPTGRLDLEIVRHPGGAVSSWAERAELGAPAAISGPARGIAIDPSVERFVLFGDETAIPAISQLLGVLPPSVDVATDIEVTSTAARIELPERRARAVTWHVARADDPPGARLVEAVHGLGELRPHDRVWVAGEAAAVQRIRTHLFREREIPRSQANVRGYWKHGPRPGE